MGLRVLGRSRRYGIGPAGQGLSVNQMPSQGIPKIDPIPLSGRHLPQISKTATARLDLIAGQYRADEPILTATDCFGVRVRCGIGPGPMLVIGDMSEIPLLPNLRDPVYEYRSAMLAQLGDIITLSEPRNEAFEQYRSEYLGMPSFEVLVAPISEHGPVIPMATRLLENTEHLDYLVKKAGDAGSLTIVPHVVTGRDWLLAGAIASAADVDVYVCGAPPRLCKRLNDKLWFAELAAKVLGREVTSTTFAAYGPSALAAVVRRLAIQWESLVIKVPDSAGSAGNIRIRSQDVRGRDLPWIKNRMVVMLEGLGWKGGFPLLVEVWDTVVLASPSVQMWIPNSASGQPIIENVFEQVVEGSVGEFVGAVPLEVPGSWSQKLSDEANQLGHLLQKLGYFGPCSFDCIITDAFDANAKLHWIECNARWGGVSLPMIFAHRILGAQTSSQYVIVQREEELSRRWILQDVSDELDELLFDIRKQRLFGIILLTCKGLETGRGMHFIAIADSTKHAKAIAIEATRRLRH